LRILHFAELGPQRPATQLLRRTLFLGRVHKGSRRSLSGPAPRGTVLLPPTTALPRAAGYCPAFLARQQVGLIGMLLRFRKARKRLGNPRNQQVRIREPEVAPPGAKTAQTAGSKDVRICERRVPVRQPSQG
jgi:hypothetical protein